MFRPRVTSTRTSVLPRFGEPRQADDHSAAQVLYGSGCLVKPACSEDMPQEKEEMVCLQPIIDAACNTLEELYLYNRRAAWSIVGKMGSLLSI